MAPISVLVVEDEPKFLDALAARGGRRGLAGMQRCARQIGAELVVRSGADGSLVSIELPLRTSSVAPDGA